MERFRVDVSGTINSSMRLYLEAARSRGLFHDRPVDVPTAVAVYPRDIYPIPRAWAEQQYRIVRWEVMPRGGHFPALEVPDVYAADMRAFTEQLDWC